MEKKNKKQNAVKIQNRKKISTQTVRETTNGFKKQYLKTRPVCKVTFSLPKEAAPEANKVTLVGDFSNWNKGCNPMKLNKSGKFTTTVELENGRDYRFRYLVDENYWVNHWQADKYIPNPYGGDDSVVTV